MDVNQQTLWEKDGFTISTDKSLLDIEIIHNFLSNESYWVQGIPLELVEASIENSILCYGVYQGNPTIREAKLVGFARVVSDLVRYSWVGDVFILPEYRGRGLSKWLMSIITEHPKLRGTSFNLGTRDAHTLYEKFGFKTLEHAPYRMAKPLNWETVYQAYNLKK